MKILPIQYKYSCDNNNSNIQYKTQIPQKTFYNATTPQSISFTGLADFFKFEKVFFTKQQAVKYLSAFGVNDEKLVPKLMYLTSKKTFLGYDLLYYKSMLQKMMDLKSEGFILDEVFLYKNGRYSLENFQNYYKSLMEMKQKGYPPAYVPYYREANFHNNEVGKLLDIRREGYKHRDKLSYQNQPVSDDDLDYLFLDEPKRTIMTLKILGKKDFVNSFVERFDYVDSNIEQIGKISEEHPLFQKLLELTNPTECKKYLENQENIKDLKSRFGKTQGKEKEDLIREINEFTVKNKNLVARSIKDYRDKIALAQVFNMMKDDFNRLNWFLKNCSSKTKGSNHQIKKLLNHLLLVDNEGNVCKRFNFGKNELLHNMCVADEDFKENFKMLLYVLNAQPKKSISEAFNNMDANLNTKAQFEKFGINYDKWVAHNPDIKVQKNIMLDGQNIKKNVIQNLEVDFNSDTLLSLPQKEVEDLLNAMKQNGFTQNGVEIPIFDEDGIFSGTNFEPRLFKNNKPIQFEDLPELFKIVSNHIKTSAFWVNKNPDKKIESAKNTFKNHVLQMRLDEMRSANQSIEEMQMQMTVRKVDMNDIEHSLFLGNHSSCCTAVGSGCNQWTAPEYILFKMMSAIEVLDGKNPIGNTMCYIADIDGKPSLILDNIELKQKYQYSDDIMDAIVECAQKIAKDIGKPDMPIFAGPNRHKMNMNKYELQTKDFRVLGDTEGNSVYLDFDTDPHTIDGTEIFESALYRIN